MDKQDIIIEKLNGIENELKMVARAVGIMFAIFLVMLVFPSVFSG